VEYLILKSNDD